jgi:hypothetical protein
LKFKRFDIHKRRVSRESVNEFFEQVYQENKTIVKFLSSVNSDLDKELKVLILDCIEKIKLVDQRCQAIEKQLMQRRKKEGSEDQLVALKGRA